MPAEEGKAITVEVRYDLNSGSKTSSPTSAVQPEDPAKPQLQGTVTISGTAEVGQTLTADTSGISNGSGTPTYQWKAGGQDIAGATNNTYTLIPAEEGKAITVEVRYPGNTGTITSAATDAVENTGGVYAVLTNGGASYNVFQDAGVSNAEMAAAYANLTTAYNDWGGGIVDPFNNRVTEIHIFPSSISSGYTWNSSTKI
jgi:hypothetical protein